MLSIYHDFLSLNDELIHVPQDQEYQNWTIGKHTMDQRNKLIEYDRDLFFLGTHLYWHFGGEKGQEGRHR